MDRHMACTQCYTVNFCKTCLIRGKNAVDPKHAQSLDSVM